MKTSLDPIVAEILAIGLSYDFRSAERKERADGAKKNTKEEDSRASFAIFVFESAFASTKIRVPQFVTAEFMRHNEMH